MSGAAVLYVALQDTVAAFEQDFAALALPPTLEAFKSAYSDLLPAFEAMRLQSPRAAQVARAMLVRASEALRFVDDAGERALSEVLGEPCEPLTLAHVRLPGNGRWVPEVDFAGRLYVGADLAKLADELDEARFVTRAASQALARIGKRAAHEEGLSLVGERFVLFGAGAELSPVYALLEAGADVLWIDRVPPPIDRLLEPRLSGSLSYVQEGVDLLAEPGAVRATILDFASEGPVHLGSYAFAPGAAFPLRLALTVDEIARSLPRELVRSFSFLLSPTTVNVIAPEDAQRADLRAGNASTMRRTLARTGTLQPAHLPAGNRRVSRAVVAQQGAAYQVAEYVGKRLAAEAFAAFGLHLDGDAPLRVSANMAPVTETRSLRGPMLEAAVLGAASFDMLIAPASTARATSEALLFHDLLHDEREADPFEQQFHGGVHAQPYALEGLMRVATLRGIAQRPKLALEMLR